MYDIFTMATGRFNTFKAVFSVMLLAIYLFGIAASGGSIFELALFIGCVLIYVFLPGFSVSTLLVHDEERNVCVSLALGSTLLCISHILYLVSGLKLILIVLPLVPVAIYVAAKIRNKYRGPSPAHVLDSNLILVYACIVFMFTFIVVVKHAHPAKVGELILSQDFMWTVGNAESLKMSFPPMDIRYRGVTLKYHYLTELIAAAISSVTGISCYNILAFYMQSFMAAFLVISLYELGRKVYSDRIKPYIFPASFFLLSCLSLWKALPNGASLFGNSLLSVLLSNINSQATSFAFLASFCISLRNSLENKGSASAKYMCFTVICFLGIVFSKSPVAAIAAIALFLASLVNMVGRNRSLKALILSGGLLMLFAVIYFGYLASGAAKSTTFSPVKTLELGYFKNFLALFNAKSRAIYLVSIPVFMLIQTVCIAPFQSVVVIPAAISNIPKLFTLDLRRLFSYACIAGGILAFFLTYHEAFSQVYFLYTAIFFLNLEAVDRFDFGKLSLKNCVPYCLMALSFATALFMLTNFGGSGIRQYLHNRDILQKYPYPFVVKREDELAGDFLRENMEPGELFITNRIHTGAGEGLSNVYTCFSGRPSYMEGFKYTVSNMGVSWENSVKPRYEFVTGVFDGTLASDEIIRMCQERNIRYILYSSQFEGSCDELINCSLAFDMGSVRIYEVPEAKPMEVSING